MHGRRRSSRHNATRPMAAALAVAAPLITALFLVAAPSTGGAATVGPPYSAQLELYGAPPPLQITTTSLPQATTNEPYSTTVQATGGTPPYTWYANGLPQGLTMSQDGTISGVSDIPQQTPITVSVVDSGGSDEQQQTSKQFTFTVSSGVAQLDPTLYQADLPELLSTASGLPEVVENEIYDLLGDLPGGGSVGGVLNVVETELLNVLSSGLVCSVVHDESLCGP